MKPGSGQCSDCFSSFCLKRLPSVLSGFGLLCSSREIHPRGCRQGRRRSRGFARDLGALDDFGYVRCLWSLTRKLERMSQDMVATLFWFHVAALLRSSHERSGMPSVSVEVFRSWLSDPMCMRRVGTGLSVLCCYFRERMHRTNHPLEPTSQGYYI